MADRAFSDEIRRLVNEEVPVAPWLEDRVMASVRLDAADRSARRQSGPGSRWALAVIAAGIIALLGVTVLVGARLVEHSTSTPAGKPKPSQDAAVLSYQAVINRDMGSIYVNDSLMCSSRMRCLATGLNTRAAVEALLHDVESTPAPTLFVPAAANLKTAAQQYIAGLDAYVASMQDPNTNYLAPAYPSPTSLDLAVAAIVCWPEVPNVARGDSTTGYYCVVQPPGQSPSK